MNTLQVIPMVTQESGGMLNGERLMNIYHLLRSVLCQGVRGAVVEVGCNRGVCGAFLRMILDSYDRDRQLHVFDSFLGVPQPTSEDSPGFLIEGDLRCDKSDLVHTFRRWELKLPTIHEGWFVDTMNDLPQQIAFAHIDCDMFSSTRTAVLACYERMSHGAVMVLDDCADPAYMAVDQRFPGVWRAWQACKGGIPESLSLLWAGAIEGGSMAAQAFLERRGGPSLVDVSRESLI